MADREFIAQHSGRSHRPRHAVAPRPTRGYRQSPPKRPRWRSYQAANKALDEQGAALTGAAKGWR